MSMLYIGPNEKEQIANLRRFAEDRDHWFRPGVDTWTPGDMPEYVVTISGYRCCFTWSVNTRIDQVYRQLSVSSPRPGTHLPIPHSVYWLASLFGFTGWDEAKAGAWNQPPEGWMARVVSDSPIPHIVVAQKIEEVE